VDRLEGELHAVRRELGAPAPASAPAAAVPPPARKGRAAPDLSWLAGPRGLAVAGGVVTLLGIVFVFALAASRGWIGAGVRCAIGGLVSAGLVVAAHVIRRRVGQYAAAVAAAGAGIGGAYVTLYAAAAGYHLLPHAAVWLAVVVIAGIAVATSLAWSAELLAVLGLVTLVLAPLAVDGHLTSLGMGASVLACAVALGLGQARRWQPLGALAFVALYLQALGFVFVARSETLFGESERVARHHGSSVAVACAVFMLAVAGAAAYQRRTSVRLDTLVGLFATSTVPLALLALWALAGDGRRAAAMLAVSVAYAVTVLLGLEPRLRELGELLGALSLLFLALATATALSNGGLAVTWSLEGLLMVAAAVRLGRRRYQAAGIAYLVAAGVHVVSIDAPIDHLFEDAHRPASAFAVLAVFAGCVGLTGWLLRGRAFVEGLDIVALVLAALLALYTVSLGVLAVAQQFERGETLVSTLWALVALALLFAGLGRNRRELRSAGFGLLGLALAKLFLFDLAHLSSLARAGSFLAVGLTLLAGGFLVQRTAAR
jgi:uncharacterized membrane protein